MFIWEGVTQYLAEPTVRSTLTFLETASSGSSLIFTFVRADFLNGTNLHGGSRSTATSSLDNGYGSSGSTSPTSPPC
jgi:O-methyltransferase involved in polyketide biosynthesis